MELIGSAFFRRLAEKKNLEFVEDGPGRGLIADFSRLRGPAFNPDSVDARVVAFYEKTADFEFDIWSEWCGAFRPFGGALAVISAGVSSSSMFRCHPSTRSWGLQAMWCNSRSGLAGSPTRLGCEMS